MHQIDAIYTKKNTLKVNKINIAHFWCILALQNILGV